MHCVVLYVECAGETETIGEFVVIGGLLVGRIEGMAREMNIGFAHATRRATNWSFSPSGTASEDRQAEST